GSRYGRFCGGNDGSPMLEPNEIDTLMTLAEELHFGRTAARLRQTTGQVSKTVKKLERRIGAPLFERTSRVVNLTAIGKQLVEDLRPHVSGMAEAVRRATDAGRGVTGTLNVGYIGAQAEQLMLNAVRLFGSRHPECEVSVRQVSATRQALLDGSVDVMFVAYPYPGMERSPALMHERRVLAIPVGHPLEGQESMSMEELADYKLLQLPADFDDVFRADRTPSHTPAGLPIPKGQVGHTFQEFLSLVSMGRGVYIVGEQTARYYPRPDVTYVHIHDAPPLERGAVWLETNSTNRVRAFAKTAADANRETAEVLAAVGISPAATLRGIPPVLDGEASRSRRAAPWGWWRR
ncbi:MAG: LysR substrate-binding domain-containing protein, partial [Stackebrandtia sp.]